MIRRVTRLLMATAVLSSLVAMSANAASSAVPEFQSTDVTRFYAVFAANHGTPTAEVLQKEYLDPGSPGLHDFAKLRKITGESLADAIKKRPEIFQDAHRCASVLPKVRERVGKATQSLRAQYPEALIPSVIVTIGRGNTGGTTGPSGVLIGLETICSVVQRGHEEDRLTHLIAHEFAHVQQPVTRTEPDHPTLLFAAIVEGGAELVAELTSGSIANPQLKTWTQGREKEVESEFAQQMESTDLDRWIWNGPGTAERPGDLAYWVGYRITKALYVRAKNKREVLKQILTMTDPHAILAASGWHPGITLPATVRPAT